MKLHTILALIIISSLSSNLRSQTINWQVTNGPPGMQFLSVSKKNCELLATDYAANVWRSGNNGQTWGRFSTPPGKGLDAFHCGSNFLAGNYISIDSGLSWQVMTGFTNNSGRNNTIKRFAYDGSTLYAANQFDYKIHSSLDCGLNWEDVTYNLHEGQWGIWDMIKVDSELFVAEWADGIYCRNVNDTVWTTRNSGLQLGVDCLFGKGNIFYAGTTDSGIYYSNNRGLNWIKDNVGLGTLDVVCLGANDSVLFAGTSRGLFKTIINSHVWVPVSTIPSFYAFQRLCVSGDSIFAATEGDGFLKSYDGGLTWKTVYDISHGAKVNALTTSSNTVFASTDNRFFRTNDLGDSWEALAEIAVGSLMYTNNVFYGGSLNSGGIYYSNDTGKHWTYTDNGLSGKIQAGKFEAIDSTLFYVKDYFYKSIDHGLHWVQIAVNPTNDNVVGIARLGADLYAVSNNKVFKSVDKGTSWTEIFTSAAPDFYIRGLAAGRTTLFLNANYTVYQSDDGGASWQSLSNSSLPAGSYLELIYTVGEKVYAKPYTYSTNGNPIYYGFYKFQSGSWTLVSNIIPTGPSAFIEYNGTILAGTSSGLLRTPSIAAPIITQMNSTEIFFIVYPNPFSNVFTIECKEQLRIQKVKIINSLGQQIFYKEYNSDIAIEQFDLNKFPKGFYYLIVSSNNKDSSAKLILR